MNSNLRKWDIIFGELDVDGLRLEELLELQAAGLVVDAAGQLSLNLKTMSRSDGSHVFLLATTSDWYLQIAFDEPQAVQIPAIPLSQVALQIIRLGRFEANEKFLFKIIDAFKFVCNVDPKDASLVKLNSSLDGKRTMTDIKPLMMD